MNWRGKVLGVRLPILLMPLAGALVAADLGLFNYAPDIAKDDQRPAFDVVDAAFSAAGVREVSFRHTYPVKARERRGEDVRSEKGGGWIGWALFRSGPSHPASAVRQAAKLNSAFPLKASENRRYLVDQTGQPFFVMGDTPWFIQKLKIEEVRMLMDDRLAKGFNTLFLELLDDSRIPSKDGYGNAAFQTDTDITRPVEAYWNYAEQVMGEAEKRGLFIIMSELWYGAGGGLWMHHVKPDNAKVYGAFIGKRFARFKNLMWMHAGDRNPDANLAECTRVLAREIQAAAPHHLHTVHNAHEFASARFHHEDTWLDVNLGYTYGAAYLHTLPEYQRTNPVRPLILGETGYEAEPNAIHLLPDAKAGDLWTPFRIRRNAWWAVTSGAMGYCAGTRLWRWEPNWRETMQVRSAREAPLLLHGLATIAWWRLAPDTQHEFLTAGLGEWQQADYATAALADDGSCAVVYLPTPRTITVDLAKLKGPVMVRWFDPATGASTVVEGAPFSQGGKREFTLRRANSAGETDWVLFCQTESPDGARLPASRFLDSRPAADTRGAPASVPGAETRAPLGALEFELHTVDAAGPTNPWTKIAGDLDGDGRDELIVGGQMGPLVWYHWPDFRKHTIADSGWNTVSGALGDVDGDGNLDVLMGGSVWFENPGQLLMNPDQAWARHLIADDPTHDIAAADFNGDGRLDVVTRSQSEFGAKSGNRIRVWLQQTDAPWQGTELECPHGEGLAVSDLDRDGEPDLVIGGTWFETIREGGQVRWQAHGFAEFHRNATVAVADFNADGRPDVALAPSELAGQHSRLSWFEAPADPRASPWREHRLADPIEAVVHSLAAADFDRDGRMDIAFAEMHQGADPDEVCIFLNRGAGHPWAKVVVSTTASHGLQILDLDGDGAPDLFGANWSGPKQTVELWRQRTRHAAEAGRDGSDGTVFSGLPRLRVSENRRFLVTADGRPFFWLADTAWWIRQLPPPLVKHYLSTRAQQGFNVIQVHCGLAVTNYAGASPFRNNAPESPNELFWRELDRVVAQARAHRLYVALVPMWGDEYGRAFGTNAARAFTFGEWIGRRYALESHVVWIVSGEYDAINGFKLPINAAQKNLLFAVARGLMDTHGGTQLMTIHPGVARTSSLDFHQEPWLDLNLLQSGHLIDSTAHRLPENHALIANDYARHPVKPVLDGEPIYEDTPDAVWIVKHVEGPRAGADAVRRKAYWSVFSGACGHTYGHNDVYGFFTPAFPGQVLSLQTRPSGPGQRGDWREALPAPGATQMQHLRRLIESRPWLTQVPDQSLVTTPETSPLEHLAALRGEGYALVYTPTGKPFRARLDKLKGREVQAWWFDPRTGESQAVGRFAREGEREFTPPGQPRAGNDWVLALDDPARQLPAPGSARFDPLDEEETKALASPAPVRAVERESAVRAPAAGPLRVLPSNRRYFTDDGQRAVYLTGAHTWDNLQDMGEADLPAAFDFNAYLDFLAKHDHNLIRLWRWELVSWDTSANDKKTAKHLVAAPHPWARTGPGRALDGRPRFNLDQFDDAYFQRLRSRVVAAGDRGIYVAVMLFEGWGVQHVTNAWKAHPFHPDNHVNGLDSDADGDGRGLEVHTLRVPAVTKVQEAYVRKIIETVNDLDNVLYEIGNEAGAYSTDWQEHFIRFIHDYEKGKPKQHPVGMTFQYSRDAKQRGSNTNLLCSSADWISPNPDAGPFNYRTNPPPADGRKVILTDTDHLWGVGGDVVWVWRSFLRGLNPLFMDPYKQQVLQGGADSEWEPVRRAMGVTRRLADRVNLAAMTPCGGLAGSGYCLANPANEYLVYLPAGDEVNVDLSGAAGEFQVEWIHPVEGRRTPAGSATGGAARTFKAPGSGGAVLHLRSRR